MPAESPLFEHQEAAKLRRRVGDIARDALERLERELEEHGDNFVAETWARKFKIVADQIRRDYRLEGEPLASAPPVPAGPAIDEDPLGKLRVVAEDEEEVA